MADRTDLPRESSGHSLPPQSGYVRGQVYAGKFIPTPDVLPAVPEGDWTFVGSAVDLALAKGSTAGFPSDSSAAMLRAEDGREVFVTAKAWRSVDPEYRP